MKINLLDPGLVRRDGHNYDWDTRIAKCLVAKGHEVSVYTYAKATPDSLLGFESNVRVEPLFRVNPYWSASTYDPVCGQIERQLMSANKTSEDLQQVDAADLWLWPTAFAYQIRSCAFVKADAEISACVHFPPDNGADPPYVESGAWWRFAARQLQLSGRRIRTIGVTEPEGRDAFLPFIGMLNLINLPVPCDGRPRRRTELRTIGFFGLQMRQEQGSDVVGALINRCLNAGFKVVLQTDDFVPPALKKHPCVTLLGYGGDFSDKVERCDLVVAAYKWHRYVGRASGVVWQAMASGIPCVAPEGASFSRTLTRMGSASLFAELTIADIFDAILRAQASYPALAEAAFRGAQAWRKENGIAKFSDVMMGLS